MRGDDRRARTFWHFRYSTVENVRQRQRLLVFLTLIVAA
jgi:hypothetical protein